ncbi:MAG: isoleucine--tRNA ligase [Eubacteriaceae bacterium]|nr:isoleucine--tRNA ligase [Eubacteriaceae bacterium]
MFKELSKKSVAETEKEIARYWEDIDILKRTIENRKDSANFVFFEGPPTANGKPGIHHVIARTLKDSVNKYHTMLGSRVLRKAGWDTHGLPVEIEVEKKLGMNGKQDIEKYGIREFNEQCKDSVFSYEALWREMTRRMAYFIDLDDPYITLDNNYIETEWWILKQFFEKGYMYEGHKILPYCPRCGTGLASHEVAQGYQMIKTDTVYVRFKIKDRDEYFLAWTTTPWTLASNVALAVNRDVTYVKVSSGGYVYILAKELASSVLEGEYEVLEEMKGADLEYTEYEQLMPVVEPSDGKKAFFVVCADYVSTTDGTGIVHIAPAFGEDDYNVGAAYGLSVMNPVDEQGKYTATPWAGLFVMDADPKIIEYLKETGKLYRKQRMEHNYPHCWRCKTPLLYYAKPSWYISTTKYKDELVAANKTVNWFPDFVGEKRFGNWLENVKDWAISRNRYWGTPLNIWKCECGHVHAVGSRKELAELAIEDIDESIELHRPYVDEVHIRCEKCGGVMTRVKDVIDCWFDSGSMPFAQWHYPFENEDKFNDQFPADFICEGIDQTRGWFYSLICISTFLKGVAPYRNVLVNDLILDAKGQKMSKSRGNTVDPFELFDKYGADALRWYLLYVSPAWTPTRFDEEGLKEVISKFFTTFKNVYAFFALYANTDGIDPASYAQGFTYTEEIDDWLISEYNLLVKNCRQYMDEYDTTKTVRAIQEFVNEDLSNWYIRRNRRRFWESGISDSKKAVFLTTYRVLEGICRLAAPFAPYITEEIYRDLTGGESVHLADYPAYDEALINEKLNYRMNTVRTLVSLGRGAREEVQIKVRQPLAYAMADASLKDDIGYLTDLIKEELNVKEVRFEENLADYMNFTIKPDFKVCGKLFGSRVKALASYLADTDAASFMKVLGEEGSVDVEIEGEKLSLTRDMLDVRINAKEGFDVQMQDNLFIILNTELTKDLINEGYAREIISKVQQLRKASGYEVADRIKLTISSDDTVIGAVEAFRDYICRETLSQELTVAENTGEKVNLNGHDAFILTERI